MALVWRAVCSAAPPRCGRTRRRFVTIVAKAKEEGVTARRSAPSLQGRRRFDPHTFSQSSRFDCRLQSETQTASITVPFELAETIDRYRMDGEAQPNLSDVCTLEQAQQAQQAQQQSHSAQKEKSLVSLVCEKVSVESSTGYLLQQRRVLSRVVAALSKTGTGPLKLSVSEPSRLSVRVWASDRAQLARVRRWIKRHITAKTRSVQCGEKRAAVVGAKGLRLRMLREESGVEFLWEDQAVPGLMHMYDADPTRVHRALHAVESVLSRTCIVALPVGQLGLLVLDRAYWLDVIREHSGALIVGLDVKPSQLLRQHNRHSQSQSQTQAQTEPVKSRLLISGDSAGETERAQQMMLSKLKFRVTHTHTVSFERVAVSDQL